VLYTFGYFSVLLPEPQFVTSVLHDLLTCSSRTASADGYFYTIVH